MRNISKNRFLLLVGMYLLFSTHMVMAQEIILTGRVLDAQQRAPLKGADVFLKSYQIGTTTDKDGIFLLSIPTTAPADTLIISFLGYKTFRQAVSDYVNRSEILLKPLPLPAEGVEVRAEKIDLGKQDIPHMKNVLRFEDIQRYGTSEIADLFKIFPSVRIEGNDLDGRQIQIRGSDPDEVNVYVDGVLINNLGFDNVADLSIIPTESIEKLEVLKGSNLTLLGSGAFGGVVNVTTHREQRASFMLKSKQGSFDSRYYIGEINLPISGRWLINYFGQYSALNPVVEYFPGERYSEKSLNKQIDTEKQNHHLNLYYMGDEGVFNAKFIGYFFDYQKPFWEDRRDNLLFSVNYQGNLWGLRDFNFNVNQLVSNDEIFRRPSGFGEFIDRFRTGRLNLRFTKKITHPRREFQFLAEYFHDEVRTETLLKEPLLTRSLYKAFLYENRWSIAGVFTAKDYLDKYPNVSWKTYLGSRGDFVSDGQKKFTHTVGAEVSIHQTPWKYTPYASFGTNYKFPTLLENAFISLLNVEQGYTLFRRLEPEFNSSFETGIRVERSGTKDWYQRLEATLAFFVNTTINKVLKRPFEVFEVSSQLGRNTTRGIEGSLRLNQLFKYINLSASFNRLSISDKLIYAYRPRDYFSVHTEFISGWGLYFSALYFREGISTAWFLDRANRIQTSEIPPYWDMDVVLGLRFKVKGLQFNLQASGYNIFDNSGFQFYLLKKRFYQFSLAVRH